MKYRECLMPHCENQVVGTATRRYCDFHAEERRRWYQRMRYLNLQASRMEVPDRWWNDIEAIINAERRPIDRLGAEARRDEPRAGNGRGFERRGPLNSDLGHELTLLAAKIGRPWEVRAGITWVIRARVDGPAAWVARESNEQDETDLAAPHDDA